jgi:hypothetical protein
VNAIPITELPQHQSFTRRFRLLLRRSRNWQLIWDFETDSAGRSRLLIWKLPKEMKCSAAGLERVRVVLRPDYSISDIDVFGVGENTCFDEDEDDLSPQALPACVQFDADAFYQQI